MAMSVAENASIATEPTPRSLQQQLAVGSFLGAVSVLLSLWVVLAGLPLAWDDLRGGTGFLFLQPGWGRVLESIEDMGWFHARSFKASQGARVRRGTIIGILVLGVCGIITLWTHRSFGYETPDSEPNNWYWFVPGTY